MKKLILLLLLIPTCVFAINYSPYSDYYYSDTYVEETDLCEVDEVKKYKYYKEVVEYTEDYYNFDFIDDNYIYRDKEFIYSDLITSLEEPNLDEVIDLEEKQYTYYQEYNKIKYLIIKNIDYSNYLKINEIIFYDLNNNRINYEIIQGPTCLNDTDSFNCDTKLNKDDVIILKLEKELSNTNFNLNIWVSGQYTSTFSFDYVLNSSANPDDIYYYGTLSGSLSSVEFHNVAGNTISYNESLNDEIKVKEGYVESIKNAKIIKYETEYSYREKLYKYYKFDRHYLDDYYLETDILDEEYLKDETDFKIVYRYRCRTILEDVVIPDEEVDKIPSVDIENNDNKLNDSIIESDNNILVDNEIENDINNIVPEIIDEEKENIKTNNKIENDNNVSDSKNEMKENNVVPEKENINNSDLSNDENSDKNIGKIESEYVNNEYLNNEKNSDENIKEIKSIYVNNKLYKNILIITLSIAIVLIVKFKFMKGKKIWKRR